MMEQEVLPNYGNSTSFKPNENMKIAIKFLNFSWDIFSTPLFPIIDPIKEKGMKIKKPDTRKWSSLVPFWI